jgi:hypothetical protein
MCFRNMHTLWEGVHTLITHTHSRNVCMLLCILSYLFPYLSFSPCYTPNSHTTKCHAFVSHSTKCHTHVSHSTKWRKCPMHLNKCRTHLTKCCMYLIKCCMLLTKCHMHFIKCPMHFIKCHKFMTMWEYLSCLLDKLEENCII